MKKLFRSFCLGLRLYKCLLCAHKNDCNYSTVVMLNKIKYLVTVDKLPDEIIKK